MGAKAVRRVTAVLACVATAAITGWALSGPASAEPSTPPPLPAFTPGPSDWRPNFGIWPYSTFTYQVTPQMINAMSESCQWFNAQFDQLMGQINDFNRNLADSRDDYSAAGVQRQADAVLANIDQSTAFLGPRVQPLTITNTPNNFGPYSPIYGGEAITGVTFQLTRIGESMRNRDPAGVTHANIFSATRWGNTLRGSGACS